MRHSDRFFPSLLDASAPLILWGFYLFAVYAFAAIACDTAFAHTFWAGYAAVKMVLIGFTVMTVGLLLILLWRAAHLLRGAQQSLMSFARVGIGVLGFIGVVWTALPIFIMTSCVA